MAAELEAPEMGDDKSEDIRFGHRLVTEEDGSRWFYETLYPGWRQGQEVVEILFREQTDLQDLVIFDSRHFGRVMALDGIVQTTEADEFIYHEMLVHAPIFAHGNGGNGEPFRGDVLIIGGGDGGSLREALKHPEIGRVVMVEIDPGVVEMSKQYLPKISAGAFDNPKGELVFADGVEYMAEAPENSFDVIVVDSTDPMGPGEVLFTESFYAQCRRVLRPDGIMTTQGGVPFTQRDELSFVQTRLATSFAATDWYMASVPTYVGGPMAFGWATDDASLKDAPVDALEARAKASGLLDALEYWTPAIHRAAFAHPAFLERALKRG